jgi:hypothetical protein
MRTLITSELTQTTGGSANLSLTFDNFRDRVLEPAAAGAAFYAALMFTTGSNIVQKQLLGYAVAGIAAYNVYDLLNS